jgi:hypothetical protein
MSLRPPEELSEDPLVQRTWDGLGRPEGFVVGGYVRDHLLGRATVDLDFTLVGDVEAVEGPARRLAAALGTRAHLIGSPPRCVWRVETSELKAELWPLGSLTLEDDILRRDFTCNALMWRLPDGPCVDRVGGLDDLRSGRLAAVSRGNLQQDPVRLLRAARFLAEIESVHLDHRTIGWIRDLSPRLAYAPKARVGYELSRLMAAPGADRGLRAILELDLFRTSAPVGTVLDGEWLAHHTAAASRLATGVGHPVPDAVEAAGASAGLALLFRSWGCPSAEATSDYAWPRSDRLAAVRAARMMDAVREVADRDSADRRELIFELGGCFPTALAASAALDHSAADAAARWLRWWEQWKRNGAALVDPPRLLATDDVKAILGCGDGPELGTALKALHRAQVRGEVRSANGARTWLLDHRPSPHPNPSTP